MKGNATAAPVKLKASVDGLQRGSNTFTLLLENITADQTVDIPTTELALSDDQGNELLPDNQFKQGRIRIISLDMLRGLVMVLDLKIFLLWLLQ